MSPSYDALHIFVTRPAHGGRTVGILTVGPSASTGALRGGR